MGTPEQELFGFMLGDMPSLVNDDPIFESAWKDRCRLFTTSAGTVRIEIFSISRYFKEQSVNI